MLMKAAMIMFVYYECWFIHVFQTNYLKFLQIPPCGGIFSGKETEKRIEEIERLNLYRPVIDEPDCFEAKMNELWKQICDPAFKTNKKLKKNCIEVNFFMYSISIWIIKVANLFLGNTQYNPG